MFKDITGYRFGRLIAIKFSYQDRNPHWLFKCDCGKEKIIDINSVIYSYCTTKSCGCLFREFLQSGNARRKHGLSKTRFYRIYRCMRNRCERKQELNYYLYGGKGIKCFWKSFEEFKKDMYKSYEIHVKRFGTKQTTIDRINSNSHYFKENCRWATYKEQARNIKTNQMITFYNKTCCINEWAEKLNIKRGTLWHRIVIAKWPIEKAFTMPVR